MPTKYNHKKYYLNPKNRKHINKFDIKSGMVINFPYKGNSDRRPLVFVMHTDEYAKPDKKSFSGINLNYLATNEINKFFIKLSKLIDWELDVKTQLPKLDLWEEEDPGVRPIRIYNSIVKKDLLKRKDCWRTYKYDKVKIVEVIGFEFDVEPLKSLIKELVDGKN